MQEESTTQKPRTVVRVRKPEWLKIRLGDNSTFTDTKHTIEHHGLNTICHSGKCPNQGECWSAGTATFMIGGAVCTRACRFCNTLSGKAPAPLDPLEPMKVAQSIKKMNLRHAVITSVDTWSHKGVEYDAVAVDTDGMDAAQVYLAASRAAHELVVVA